MKSPYQLTDNDKVLIRGMNQSKLGWNPYTKMVDHFAKSNIAALHFDGPLLADMVAYLRLNPKLDGVR